MSNFKIGNSKFARFINGKGFYIALAVCLVAIGTAAYIAVNNSVGVKNNIASQTTSSASSASSIPNWDSKQTNEVVSGVSSSTPSSSSKTESSSSATSQSSSSKAESSAPSKAPTKLVFTMPIQSGKVLNSFTGDSIVSDVTMGDFRVHNGIDLGADQGTAVKACAQGKVTEIKVDDMLGQTVVIDHGNGLKTSYSNLTNKVTVKEGQNIEVGTVIGAIGDTALSEMALSPHLHFEMTQNGKQIDPLAKISPKQ